MSKSDRSRLERVLWGMFGVGLFTAFTIAVFLQQDWLLPEVWFDSTFSVLGSTITISRDNVRFAISSAAAAQASILAIVFSVTFLGVQLVSTSYTLRTLGEFSVGALFSTAFLLLSISILADILLLLLLPDPLSPPFFWLTIVGLLLFLGSVGALFSSVEDTLQLSTPEGLAAFIRDQISIQTSFESIDINQSEVTSPCDPLHSLTMSAVKDAEWATVDEAYAEYKTLIEDIFTHCDPTNGTDENEVKVSMVFSEIFIEEYRQLILSTHAVGNEDRLSTYITDLREFTELAFRHEMPQVGLIGFEALSTTVDPGQPVDNDQIDLHQRLVREQLKLTQVAAKHGHQSATLEMVDSLRSELSPGNPLEEKINSSEHASLMATATVTFGDVITSVVPELDGQESPEQIVPFEYDGMHRDSNKGLQLFITTFEYYYDQIVLLSFNHQGTISDERWKDIRESFAAVSAESCQYGRENFIKSVLRRYIGDSLANGAPDSEGMIGTLDRVFGDNLAEDTGHDCYLLAAMMDSLSPLFVKDRITECKNVLDNQQNLLGSGDQAGWRGEWVERLARTDYERCKEDLNKLKIAAVSIHELTFANQFEPETVCSIFEQNCTKILETEVLALNKLREGVYACKFDDQELTIAIIQLKFTPDTWAKIGNLVDSIEQSKLPDLYDVEYNVVTCTTVSQPDDHEIPVKQSTLRLSNNKYDRQQRLSEY